MVSLRASLGMEGVNVSNMPQTQASHRHSDVSHACFPLALSPLWAGKDRNPPVTEKTLLPCFSHSSLAKIRRCNLFLLSSSVSPSVP